MSTERSLAVASPANQRLTYTTGVFVTGKSEHSSYNVLAMDAACFRQWAKLMHGKSDTVYEDAMIAATALTHNFVPQLVAAIA